MVTDPGFPEYESEKNEPFDLLITGGTIMTPGGCQNADIGVRNGKIARIASLSQQPARTVFDARGLHILPGVIDTQVHFREPGMEHKETIESGTRGAVLGGVTCVFEMPNTKPATIDAQALQDKLNRAAKCAWCDHAFFIGATPGNTSQLAELETLPGCAGVKIFMGSSTGDLLVDTNADIGAVLRSGRRRVSVHCEDQERLNARQHLIETQTATPSLHPIWRDVETAFSATRRLIRLARLSGRRVHVLHITTQEEIRYLAEHRDIATTEVTPQHLTLSAPDCYDRLGSFAQMNPPIREERHRQALWRALGEGMIDVLGSDHAPHNREEKQQPYPHSPSGMTGVQTLLPIMLDHVAAGHLGLKQLIDLTAAGPSRIFGIAGKGRIACGYDADFAVVDLKKRWIIEENWIASKSGWTPYAGQRITGQPVATILRGQIVMRDGAIQGHPSGQAIRFTETLPPKETDS